jgi:hypothetical protein
MTEEGLAQSQAQNCFVRLNDVTTMSNQPAWLACHL